ncbi:MAG: hypothetical protein ACXVEE_30865 [Polyangiales bacterium]
MRGAWLLSSLLVIGCGPSFKTLVESDMRFEHCYRIDEDARVPLEQKRACWGDWNARYSRGQDRARVSYAKDRLAVLNGAAAVAPPPPTAVACPTPSSPYAPPPQMGGKEPNKDPGDAAAANGLPSSQACSDACTKAWKVCISPCGKGAECFSQCDTSFKGCMKACF